MTNDFDDDLWSPPSAEQVARDNDDAVWRLYEENCELRRLLAAHLPGVRPGGLPSPNVVRLVGEARERIKARG